jgi:ribosomal protein S18 acetylase RimI-like enzyme
MVIRKAEHKDLAHLTVIKNSDMAELLKKRIKEMEEGKGDYLVAEEGDEVVGHVFLRYYGTPHIPEYPNINDLAVRVDKRGQGIGTALVRECEKLSKEKGYSQIGIQVNPEPDCPAQRLYKKLGYTDVGNKPYLDGVYDGVEDWVIDMVKDL